MRRPDANRCRSEHAEADGGRESGIDFEADVERRPAAHYFRRPSFASSAGRS